MTGPARTGNPVVWTVVACAAVFLAGVFVQQTLTTGGWEDLLRYGASEDGRNWAQRMPTLEGRFHASLLLLLPLALVAGWWARTTPWTDRLAERLVQRERAVIVVAAVLTAVTAWCVGHLVLGTTPISDDEWAYLHHARVVAGGAWTAASPHFGDRVFYDNIFVINNGQWYSQYPVGNPLTLAPGLWLGDPWTVPALLCGGVVLLLGRSARELFGPGAGATTAALAASSPFLLASAGTLLAHVPCLFWLSLYLYAGLRATRPSASPLWAVVAAVAFGLGVLTRPVSTVIVGLPLLVLLIHRWFSADRRWPAGLAFAVAGGAMVGLQLWINHTCNGDALRSAYFVYWLEPGEWRNPFGFGEFLWGIEHTAAAAWGNLWHNAVRLDTWLFGWPVSLALPGAGLFVVRGRRLTTGVLLAAALAPFVLYFFFFWPGIADVGPVLYTESTLAWFLLAGAALTHGPLPWRRFALGFAAASMVVGVLTFHVVQAHQLADTAREAGALVAEVEGAVGDRRALVFCDLRESSEDQRSWVVGRPNPSPDLDDDILYVQSVDPRRNYFFARNRHPDRVPYLVVRDASYDLSLRCLEGRPLHEW